MTRRFVRQAECSRRGVEPVWLWRLLLAGVALIIGTAPATPALGQLNIAAFGRCLTWNDRTANRIAFPTVTSPASAQNIGVEWDDERDVREVKARFTSSAPRNLKLQYWFRNWPYPPPKLPTIEDPVDDFWQGEWLTAESTEACEGDVCTYKFQPLTEKENKLAKNLPGVDYRRSLRVRLVSGGGTVKVSALEIFTGATTQTQNITIQLGYGDDKAVRWTGAGFEVYNGNLVSAKPWQFSVSDQFQSPDNWQCETGKSAKGMLLALVTAIPALSGSHDMTVVHLKATAETGSTSVNRGFSFNVEDLKRGPIWIPSHHVLVSRTEDRPAKPTVTGKKRIREMIPAEPEQSYERASREIPPLDPWQRQWGGRMYLPLAADASWQKFAFEYGGNVFISKGGTKAKAKELARLKWKGDDIQWRIGTGATPYFREDRKAAVRKLEDYLPVVIQSWENEGLAYQEEAFAAPLRGPLSPDDSGRDEQTPSVLMMRLTVTNSAGSAKTGRIWLTLAPEEQLAVKGAEVEAVGDAAGKYPAPRLRAVIETPHGEAVSTVRMPGSNGSASGVSLTVEVPAQQSQTVILKLPFVSDMNAQDIRELTGLPYDAQRERVVSYWKALVEKYARFNVPEPKFNALLHSVICHIRISTTKDPRSGLYMVPAASYGYQVFANEAAFQSLLLDTLGDLQTSGEYLETLLKLQGSRNFPGSHQGPTDAIFHGAKVDDQYDYTASGYGLDHGTVLWVLAEHYLYSRDRKWLEHAWPHMEKAIDWIVRQRATTMQADAGGQRVREYGLLPAAELEDNADWAYWFANNAYAWAGMDRTARALADVGHPEAARVRREADAYKEDLRAAVLRASESAPVVRLRDGAYVPCVPVQPWRRFRLFAAIRNDYYTRYKDHELTMYRLSATREALYGPLILLSLGLFGVEEPIAGWVLDDWEDNVTLTSGMGLNVHGLTDDKLWFSQGTMAFQANLQSPFLVYLNRREIPAAIRSAYNSFVACLYPDVNVFTEEYREWRHASGPFYKISDEARFAGRVRDMLAHEEGDDLWLAAGIPRRWLESKDGVHVNHLVTYFGELSYTLRAGDTPSSVEGEIRLPARNPAKKAWLVARVPVGKIQGVTINDRPWSRLDPSREAIELPQTTDLLKVKIVYR